MRSRLMVTVVALALAACASTGVVPMDGGTFMIAKRSAQLGVGPPVGVKADVYREANEYCARQGKGVETVKLEVTDTGLARSGSVTLQFRCVAAGAPAKST